MYENDRHSTWQSNLSLHSFCLFRNFVMNTGHGSTDLFSQYSGGRKNRTLACIGTLRQAWRTWDPMLKKKKIKERKKCEVPFPVSNAILMLRTNRHKCPLIPKQTVTTGVKPPLVLIERRKASLTASKVSIERKMGVNGMLEVLKSLLKTVSTPSTGRQKHSPVPGAQSRIKLQDATSEKNWSSCKKFVFLSFCRRREAVSSSGLANLSCVCQKQRER